jgi:hypothetical protein
MRINVERELEQETAEDIFFGQAVMIWARWFLIVAGTVFFLWTAQATTELALGVLPIVGLMAVNFYLHGRYLLERPSNVLQIVTASAIDIGLISAIVLLWHSSAVADRTGLASPFFVFYYPVLLAFAFVVPRRLTVVFTSATAAIYAAICLPDVTSITSAKVLVLRLATMIAMGALGTFYWRIQRDRRRPSPEVAA